MDHLFRLKDTLVGYLSPSKRRRTVGPGTPTRDATSPELPMSAPGGLVKRRIKIVREYHVQPFTPTDTKKFPAGSRKRGREDDNEAEEYDEQEVEEARGVVEAEDVDQEMIYEVEEDSQQFLVDSDDDEEEGSEESDGRSDAQSIDSDDSVDPEESASQLVQNDEDLTGEIGDDNILEAESELSAEAKVKLYLEKQKQLETIRGKIDDTISKGDWTEDESFLLQKLAARSFEPLLPAEWQIDFRTWPQILFTLDDKKTFINYNCTSSSRGVKALQSLVALAGRVRDKKAANRSDERLMFIEVNRYIRWSQDDGGYSKLRFIPNIVAVAGQPGKTPDMLSREITSQMQFLAGVYRKSLEMPPARLNELGEKEMFYSRTPPVIYGIVIANSHTIFWTLDSSKVDAKPKFIWHFDFSEKHMDVWNAIAVAIFVVMARNYMMSIKHELEEETQVESDPDL